MDNSFALTPAADLISQQVELESEMTAQGVARFRALVEKARAAGREDSTVYGLDLLDRMMSKVAEGMAEFVAQREAGKAGRKGPTYKYVKLFSGQYEVGALIALRVILGGLTGRAPLLTALSGRIGRAMLEEARYREVRDQDATFYADLKREAEKRSAYRVKRKVVNHFIAQRDMELMELPPEADLVLLGTLMVEIVIRNTGLVEKQQVVGGPTAGSFYLVPTEETKDFIAKRSATAELLRPVYEPMIVPPADWTGPLNGGYLTRRVRPLRLVKSTSRKYLHALESQDLSDVMEAVNIAQRTAWAINPFILTALEIGWEKDFSLGGIPHLYDSPLPPKPHDIDTNEEARKAWRGEAASVHLENIEASSKRTAFLTALSIARRYSLFPAIYFPYQLDFRGRIYAAPQLNPQGPDWMKAMLQFAEGKPLDEESAPFLAIHLANCGAFNKIDKAPLEERVRWVYDNEEAIVACADAPFENRWWTEADSPYCFLAACREWVGWLRQGPGFISHLAVALDGSCSGIQHFSMALADEVGGRAVNLVPSDKPADIYTLVLEAAVQRIKKDATSDSEDREVARQWLRSGLLTRSTFKRPTMTFGYGSNHFGFREQILTDTLRPVYKAYQRGEGEWHFVGNGFAASLYLAKVTMDAVQRTVIKAAEAMTWLKKVAGVVTAEGLPVRWTTPDGFLVVQQYMETKTHTVDTMLFGERVQIKTLKETPNVDKRRQASGFPPNHVHSLDATHLRLAVRAAAREGVAAFALVHDSFGTHAADTGRFFVILRETMVDLYKDRDVLSRLWAELASQLSPERVKDLPQPPAMGTLDIEAVVDCDFAFA